MLDQRCLRSSITDPVDNTVAKAASYHFGLEGRVTDSIEGLSEVWPLSSPSLMRSTVSKRLVTTDFLSTNPCCSGTMPLLL